ncbi:MAG: fimbrillin family protein [Muribaculaceae bacterium]
MNKFAKHIAILAGAALTVASTACDDDFGRDMGNGADRDKITFSVSSQSQPIGRSADSDDTEIIEIKQRYTSILVGNDTVALCVTEMPNSPVSITAPVSDEDILSRSTPITNDNFTYFDVVARSLRNSDNNTNIYFAQSFDGPQGTTFLTDRYWPVSTNLTFFAASVNLKDNKYPGTQKTYRDWLRDKLSSYTGTSDYRPQGTAISYENNNKLNRLSFDYVLPEANADKKRDAEAQPDIVTAMTIDQAKQDNAVNLKFHHVLSAINFKIGTIHQNITVNSVSLKNVYGGGLCYHRHDPSSDSNPNERIFWQQYTGEQNKTYTQTFNTDVTAGPGNQATDNAVLNNNECTFMMIPQTLSDASAVEITFTIKDGTNGFSGDRKYTFSKPIKGLFTNETWLPDYKYIITIGLDDEEMGISVTDDCTTTVKSNVKIQNTGFATGYVRAAIVGFWKNTSGDIIVPWNDDKINPTEYGKFEWNSSGGVWKDHWKLASDNYYYHKEPVVRNQYTYPLFNTYTLTAAAPVTGAVLEIDIVAQIIHEKDIDTWPAFRISWP